MGTDEVSNWLHKMKEEEPSIKQGSVVHNITVASQRKYTCQEEVAQKVRACFGLCLVMGQVHYRAPEYCHFFPSSSPSGDQSTASVS